MNTRNRHVALSILGLVLLLQSVALGKEFYVIPMGNDTNLGTRESPFKTLEAARNAVRKVGGSGHTIWVGAGEYNLTEAFVLNKQDGGNIWRAVKGADVRLIGGQSIDPKAFKLLANEAVKARLSEEAAKKVLVADLKKLGITNYGKHQRYGHALPVCPAPLELFFNDAAMMLARYPNDDFIQMGKVIDRGSVPRTGDFSNRGGIFEYTDARHAKWAGQKDIWFQGTFGNGYADDKILVEWIDPEKKQIKFIRPHLYGLTGEKPYLRYKALNILDELDEPGEWYLDRDSGKLYFWPPAELKSSSIKISMLEDPIVCIENATNIVFRDITVEVGRGIGIYMEGGSSNLVAGCTIRNVGTCGILLGQGAEQRSDHITHDDFDGVPQSRRMGCILGQLYNYTTWQRNAGFNQKILSCDVYNTGCGGIFLSGGSKKNLINGNNVVENCKVYNYNRRTRFCYSGVNIDGCGNRIAHCDISGSNFQAIYARGNEHIYEYNEIHHVTENGNDISPWYIGRDPSDCGNVIRYNYFHHIGNPHRMNMGIYCDDSSTDVHVYGNVFYKMNTGEGVLYSNGGWDLTMENNIVIYPKGETVVLSPQYYTWAKVHVPTMFAEPDGLFVQRLLEYVDITRPPYSERYPNLTSFMDKIEGSEDWEGMRSRRNILRNNVIVGGPEQIIRLRNPTHAHFDEIGNYRTDEDPGFVDMENGNFNLHKDSVVFEKIPGFKPVPFDKMGLYLDEYRTEL